MGAAALTALAWAQGSPLSKSESRAQNGFRTAIFINVIGSSHAERPYVDPFETRTRPGPDHSFKCMWTR